MGRRHPGDGLGYDILSFEHETERERWVEVKTTGLGKFFPFLVTENELRCSEDAPALYALYRVHSFSIDPRVYVLKGALRENCTLLPDAYRAYPHGR